MKPWRTVHTASLNGKPLVLRERGGEFLIQIDGQVLMTSREYESEKDMAVGICKSLKGPAPRVLIGGLGVGHTLRAALDALPSKAEVTVAEISPHLVEWNRTELAHVARRPLEDPRTRVVVGDVANQIRAAAARWDAILLDVDNGPSAMTVSSNAGLYGAPGLAAAHRALAENGVLAVWSAGHDVRFESRLRDAGFQVEVRHGPDILFVARRNSSGSRSG